MNSRMAIVTLNFNQSRYLLEAVRSIQDQSLTDWDLVIIDPGSSDGAQHVYAMPEIHDDTRIRVIREPDNGPSDGLNKGFGLAHGEICYFLNADDRILPGAFAEALNYFEGHPLVDVVSGRGYIIDSFGRRLRQIVSDKFDATLYLAGRCVLVQQSTFFRRAALDAGSGFNVANRVSWDGELFYAMARQGCTFGFAKNYWGEFRIYPGTITAGISTAAERARIQQRLRDTFEGAGGVMPSRASQIWQQWSWRVRSHPTIYIGLLIRRILPGSP